MGDFRQTSAYTLLGRKDSRSYTRRAKLDDFIRCEKTGGWTLGAMEKLFAGYVNARLDSYLKMLEIS